MQTRVDAGVILRRRLHDNHMSQADASRIFGKSRAWGSQELFADPKKTLRRMLIDQPAAVEEFARKLGWASSSEMLGELDIFEMPITYSNGASISDQPAPKRRRPIAESLLDAAAIHGDRFPDLRDPAWQDYLNSFRNRGAKTDDPDEWLSLYKDLAKHGITPGEN